MATIKKISGVTESTAPASSDWILMETTGGVFQKVKLSNLSGTHTHSYLPLSGGTMQGQIKFNSTSLPQKTLSYICGIDAFANGGEMGWQSKEEFLSGHLPLSGGTVTGDLTVNKKLYVGGTSAYISYNSSTESLDFVFA